jgi:GNAT superfamily N-acetyltransferase
VTGPRLRPARAGDGEGIARVLADHRRWDELPVRTASAGAQIEALIPESHDPNRTMVVAEDGVGGVAGYAHWAVLHPAHLAGPSLYLTELFVAVGARGAGVGSALLGALHEEASALGASRVELLQVRGTDADERGFYTDRGYEVADHLQVLRRVDDVRPVRPGRAPTPPPDPDRSAPA